ncbi:glutathione S-transferase [Streptomyces sp. CNQ-509]|uniref:DUF952 domain-containing protein n=1 Tax=Streptomyces sp. CNQ-509 TaxID=444103 RepID=UPI00062DDCA3|nr:DUF952 domain-containing protein [Streptomyces sp. CNQ-509]AKH81607.1 glutathione S-transferase [Streptomyces sp. CNQ-509]
MTTELWHITERARWEAARRTGVYEQSTRGRTLAEEGYIHCSLPHQLAPVAQALYGTRPEEDPVVLVIDAGRLSAPVRFEAAEPGGEEFPHVYGPIPADAVVRADPWPAPR